MKITIEHYGEKVSWESNGHSKIDDIDETTINEVFVSFIGLLITCGWQPETINEQILSMADEIDIAKNMEAN